MNKTLSRSHVDEYHLNSPPLQLILLRDFQASHDYKNQPAEVDKLQKFFINSLLI